MAAATTYVLCADLRSGSGTTAYFTVDGNTAVALTSNMPAANMKPWVTATSTAGAALGIGLDTLSVETR